MPRKSPSVGLNSSADRYVIRALEDATTRRLEAKAVRCELLDRDPDVKRYRKAKQRAQKRLTRRAAQLMTEATRMFQLVDMHWKADRSAYTRSEI